MKLTEDMVIARTKTSDLSTIKKFNCWGAGLSDVTLMRRFTNVEVLSLSLNSIASLADFQNCKNLVELYVRRNNIRDLTEIYYLTQLPKLRRLLLSENPCVDTAGNLYRLTVIRCLPNLEMLDNTKVEEEEVEQAQRVGLILEHPLNKKEEGSPEPGVYYGHESPHATSPQIINSGRRNSGPSEEDPTEYRTPTEYFYQNEFRESQSSKIGGELGKVNKVQQSGVGGSTNNISPCTNNNNPNVLNSNSTSSPTNYSQLGGAKIPTSPPYTSHHTTNTHSSPHPNNYDALPQRREISPESGYVREVEVVNGRRLSGAEFASDYERVQQFYDEPPRNNGRISNVSARNTATSRQRTKTSNLLSAVLCLIPELDFASLEVVELAIRRRMDEIHSD